MWVKKASRLWACCAPRPVAPDRRAHHHRHADRAARHVAHLGGLVGQLVHHAEQEVAVLHVGDRPHAGHGRADGHAGEADLGDGRVEDALVAELVRQAQRDGEGAAEAAGDADVLADAEDALVAPHLLADGLAQRLGDAHLCHVSYLLPLARHRVSASAGCGIGAGFGEGDGVVDRCLHLGLDASSSSSAWPARARLASCAAARDRLARAPVGLFLLGAVGARVAARVAAQAVGLALDQRRAAAAPGARDRLAAPPRTRPARRCRPRSRRACRRPRRGRPRSRS